MQVTLLIGFARAKTAREQGTARGFLTPPPVDLLAPKHGIGVVPLAPDTVRLHRGQRVTSPTFRAAAMSGVGRWRHPGVSLDLKRARFGPARIVVMPDQKGNARSGNALGFRFHVHTGRVLALQVGIAIRA